MNIQDKNGAQLKDGDIIDIHQTVNGQSKFVVKSVTPINIVYDHDRNRQYEYDMHDLIAPSHLTGEVDFEIIGNVNSLPVVYVKVSVTERLPGNKHHNVTFFVVGWNSGAFDKSYIHNNGKFIQTIVSNGQTVNKEYETQPDWWLEERTLPTDDDIEAESLNNEQFCDCFDKGANYILNKLK